MLAQERDNHIYFVIIPISFYPLKYFYITQKRAKIHTCIVLLHANNFNMDDATIREIQIIYKRDDFFSSFNKIFTHTHIFLYDSFLLLHKTPID